MYYKPSKIFLVRWVVRPTIIMNRADKNLAHFQKTNCFKNQSFYKISLISWSPSLRFVTEKNGKDLINFGVENDFESQNFAIFWEVVDNFGRSDDDMI